MSDPKKKEPIAPQPTATVPELEARIAHIGLADC